MRHISVLFMILLAIQARTAPLLYKAEPGGNLNQTLVFRSNSTMSTFQGTNASPTDSATSLLAIYPQTFLDQIDSIPDYYQRDLQFGGFPRKGASYCGPVALSNSLIWFGNRGYPNLFDLRNDSKENQHALIAQLGSAEFINTGSGGSSPSDICRGLSRYLHSRNLTGFKISYQGWRMVPRFFRTSVNPDLCMLRKSIYHGAAVWINIGWYRFDPQRNDYFRTGGHWVTLAGFGHSGQSESADYLIVHDPETRRRVNDYLYIEKLADGRLSGSMKNLPRSASGYYRYQVAAGKYGIIDGAVILELPAIPVAQAETR